MPRSVLPPLALMAVLAMAPRAVANDGVVEGELTDAELRPLLASPTRYATAAREVTEHVQTAFYLPRSGLYAHSLTEHHPAFMWGNGIQFSALLGAARHDPKTYSPLVARFFTSMDRYWDTAVKVPGYEPSPTRGGGNDKYYDDNAWMVLTYAEAYEMTRDKRYLDRARQTLDFVLSGEDDRLGGGIWWHEGHKDDSKNTCVNAPAAVGCLRLARLVPTEQSKPLVARAEKLVAWTDEHLRADDGLYFDRTFVSTGKVNRGKLTYNTALMIRAHLGLYRATHEADHLRKAVQSATAADWFLDKQGRAFRDPVKWSHLLVEADLELFRATRDPHLLQRAIANADHDYAAWKAGPPPELIENASIARTLWLMADLQTREGRQFWGRVDKGGG